MLDEAFDDQALKESFYVELSYSKQMDFQELQSVPPIVNHRVIHAADAHFKQDGL